MNKNLHLKLEKSHHQCNDVVKIANPNFPKNTKAENHDIQIAFQQLSQNYQILLQSEKQLKDELHQHYETNKALLQEINEFYKKETNYITEISHLHQTIEDLKQQHSQILSVKKIDLNTQNKENLNTIEKLTQEKLSLSQTVEDLTQEKRSSTHIIEELTQEKRSLSHTIEELEKFLIQGDNINRDEFQNSEKRQTEYRDLKSYHKKTMSDSSYNLVLKDKIKVYIVTKENFRYEIELESLDVTVKSLYLKFVRIANVKDSVFNKFYINGNYMFKTSTLRDCGIRNGSEIHFNKR